MFNTVLKYLVSLNPQILIDMVLGSIYEKYSKFFKEDISTFHVPLFCGVV